jgi:signal transduction histidine kinase
MSRPAATRPPAEPDALPAPWLAAALEALPVAVAVRDGEALLFANAAHRALAPHLAPAGEGEAELLAGLQIGPVSDPESGRLYLLTRTPLGSDTPDGPVLEVLEEVTGRHSDRDEIARQRDALARHAAALERANGELAGLDRTRAEFIALAAHELRTPLSAVTSAVQLLGRSLPGGCAPEMRSACGTERFLDMAGRNLRRLAALADDLSDFTQLDARPAAPEGAPTDLAALLAESAAEAEAASDDVRVAARSDAADPVLPGDPDRLGRMLRHLLAHAARLAPAGGTVRARLSGHDHWEGGAGVPDPPSLPGTPAGWLELVVEGIGAAPDEMDGTRPFDGFAAAGTGLPDGRSGSGLDLAVCGRIVALHGGAAWVRTEARLLPLAAAWGGPAHPQARLLVAAPASEGAAPADLLAACRAAAGPEARWVAVPETGEVVGIVDAGTDPAALSRAVQGTIGTSSRENGAAPIRMGWAGPGPDRSLADALARARAAARAITADPLGKGTGEGDA